MYEAYCDGSYQSSLNAGGWSSIILKDDKIIKELYQGYTNTTNNRMEIMAIIETLKFFNKPVEIIIYSDSQYVVNTITYKWYNNWLQDPESDKKNLDLWKEVKRLTEYHLVIMKWVKGHEDNEMNNLADMLAVHAAQCLNLPNDEFCSTNV